MKKILSVKKLRDDLDFWIHIGIGDDIVAAAEARPEYQHLVRRFKEREVKTEQLPHAVLMELELELLLPFWKRPTFWRLLWLAIKGLFK